MKSFLSLVVLLISTVSHHVVSSFSSSTTTTSQHAGNNKSNKNRILVISPPGDTVGQVAAVETACLGHDVKWFIVSLEPHKRKFGELKLSSGESGGGKRLRTNEPSTNRLKKKKSWRQPPRSWTRNIKKIGPPEERSGVRAAIAEFQQLRRVSEEDLGDDLHEERTHSYQQPHDVSFESLAAKAESLNIAGGASKFSAAARILLHQNDFPLRAIWPEPAVVKPKPAAIDDTRPLGYEWHIDDKDRRVRRSLRMSYCT
jgi:hypothetical protein